jgi:hypothetical protein
MKCYLRFLLTGIFLSLACLIVAQTDNSTDLLVRVLQAKGVLTEAEARSITANASSVEQRDRLAVMLRDKGVISLAEFEAVRTNTPSLVARTITADYKSTPPNPAAAAPQEQGYYRTRADFRTGLLPLFRGVPSFTTHNIRFGVRGDLYVLV